MKLRGGYNVLLDGRPDHRVKRLPEPETLYLPLTSQRFNFSDICVEEGEDVNAGDMLARDPDNYSVPLLAPRAGSVRLQVREGHIVLENIAQKEEHADMPEEELEHIVEEMGKAGLKRYKLLSLGAWQFFSDAYTGELPNPLGTPQAIIVSTVSLDPFTARGDVQLHNRLLQFTRGLEHLQSLLEYQPMYLVMPKVSTDFASRVREHIRGYAWAKLVEIPLTYPYNNPAILARHLGLHKDRGPVWSVRTEGVLAIDRALTLTKPCTVRIVAIGGPGVDKPVHVLTMTGYPVHAIRDMFIEKTGMRVINGGILSGTQVDPDHEGLETECRGLTVIPELEEREFLGFVRPGYDRESYSGSYLSALRGRFCEKLTTAVRGEGRPCVSCNYCEEVCPAGIMPHYIHKNLYKDLIDEVNEARVDLCVGCGLCSYVCPSKIELREQFREAIIEIELEKEETRKAQEQSEEEKS